MSSPLKTLLKRIYHGWFHRGVLIEENCFVDRRAQVARAVKIRRGSTVFPATLFGETEIGPRGIVGEGCRIGTSRLAENVGLEPRVEIYNSTLGENIRIQPHCRLTDVHLGRFSYVAQETILNQVRLGSFVSIGPRCYLGAGEHPVDFASTSPAFYSDREQCGLSFADQPHFTERQTIHLGHDVWLGAHVFVRDGVTIGDGAIVAAGSIVTKDVPPYAIVGGVPAKVIRSRFEPADVQRLTALQWWTWDEARLRRLQPAFAQKDIAEFLRRAETER